MESRGGVKGREDEAATRTARVALSLLAS
jgi:hypothetical protein